VDVSCFTSRHDPLLSLTLSSFLFLSIPRLPTQRHGHTSTTTTIQQLTLTVSGPFWYASGATIQVLLFGVIAINLKKVAPSAHTFAEIVNVRWGKTAHITFLFFGFCANVIVTSMLLLGGAATVQALTGMDYRLAAFLIPWGVILYTASGGLQATFLASYIHTVIIFMILILMVFIVYIKVYSADQIYTYLDATVSYSTEQCEQIYSKNNTVESTFYVEGMYSCGKVEGNYDGSYLTMISSGGLMFGIINIVGNFGTVFVDQSYWQSAIAARPQSAAKGYLLGGYVIIIVLFRFLCCCCCCFFVVSSLISLSPFPSFLPSVRPLSYMTSPIVDDSNNNNNNNNIYIIIVTIIRICWFAIPFTLATSLGLTSTALMLPITAQEAGDGLVPPAVAQHLLGDTGAVLILIMLFMAIVSTGSAESIAVSSLVSYDIYRQYFNPEATGKQILFVSRVVIVFFGLIMGAMAIALQEIGLNLGWVYLFMGIVIGSSVIPLWNMMTWDKASGTGAVIAAWTGFFLALTGWLSGAYIQSGEITIATLGSNEVMLSGNLIAILSSGLIHYVYSKFIDPQNYDFSLLDEQISLVEEDKRGLTADEQDATMLRRAERWIIRRGYILSLVLVVIWPLLSIPARVFTRSYFSFWVLVAIAWGFGAAIIITFLPLIESSEEISTALSGLFYFIICKEAPQVVDPNGDLIEQEGKELADDDYDADLTASAEPIATDREVSDD
jgi:Na+/proline symporter